MLSFSLVAEALTGLFYHRPLGENSTFQFGEVHSYHFTQLDSLHDNITETDDDSDLVADVDPDTLIHIVLKMVRLQV